MRCKKVGKWICSSLTGVLLLNMMTGCRKEPVENLQLPGEINEIGNNVSCIDEMPDWTGKEFDLVTWYCHGTRAPDKGKTAKKDLFREELKRVSGITVNAEKSFDNNGESGDVKISNLIARDEFPDIAFDLDLNLQARLIKAGKIYDLTELIPKYAVNLMKIVNTNDQSKAAFEDLKVDDKLYYFPKCTESAYQYIDTEYLPEKYSSVMENVESRGWIWVRDDILKMLYPDCKTQAEILEQYIDKGEFTVEELTDVTVTSIENLRQLLEKIDSLRLTENGNKVWPFYTHNGTDNWSLLSVMNYMVGANNDTSYVSYYDLQEKKIMPTMKQPWFKDLLRFYNKLVRDGLASDDALTDDREEFERKKNNGEYAVLYGLEEPPSEEVLKKAGKNFSYRKVLLDIPINYNKFAQADNHMDAYNGLRITIFKSERIKEEDLEQIIRFLDFFYSDAGMKFSCYGPEKSGLYKETENGPVYIDSKMEADMIDNGSREALAEYGFSDWPSLEHFATRANIYDPSLIYARLEPRRTSLYTMAWNSNLIEEKPEIPLVKIGWNIWNWTQYVEGLQKFWDARQAFETALQLIFTARNDEDFDLLYQDMIDIVERNGLTEETMEEWNIKFNEMNKDYIYNLQNWKP